MSYEIKLSGYSDEPVFLGFTSTSSWRRFQDRIHSLVPKVKRSDIDIEELVKFVEEGKALDTFKFKMQLEMADTFKKNVEIQGTVDFLLNEIGEGYEEETITLLIGTEDDPEDNPKVEET